MLVETIKMVVETVNMVVEPTARQCQEEQVERAAVHPERAWTNKSITKIK